MTVSEATLQSRDAALHAPGSASDAVASWLERRTSPLDAARRRVIAFALATPLRSALSDRDRRLAVMATVGVLCALAATVAFPAVLFAVSPILLGVPHVASDVRYLVLRRRLPTWWKWGVLGGCAVMLALRIAQELGGPSELLRAEVSTGTAWLVAAALAGALVSGSWRRLCLALPLIAVIGVYAQMAPYWSVLGLTHGHNVIAIVLWLLLFRRRPAAVWFPVLLVACAAVWLVSGAATPVIASVGGATALGVDMTEVSRWLAPGLAPGAALAVTFTYVFLQAIHYSVWLGWIPQEDVRAEGTLTFRMSARSLLADFGLLGLLALAGACALVIGFAAFDLVRTRDVYLSLAAFHGYLELAMLAYLFTAASVTGEPASASVSGEPDAKRSRSPRAPALARAR